MRMSADDVELVCVALAAIRQIRFEGFERLGEQESSGVWFDEPLFRRAAGSLGGVDEAGGYRVVDDESELAALPDVADFELTRGEVSLVERCVKVAVRAWGEEEFEMMTGFTPQRAEAALVRLHTSARDGVM